MRGPLALLALLLLLAAPAGAQTSEMPAPGPLATDADLELVFEDPMLVDGAAWPDSDPPDGVRFRLSTVGNAKYRQEFLPRAFGPPPGYGAINNFAGLRFPYPDIRMLFDDPVERVGFAMRANAIDSIIVTVKSGGTVETLSPINRGGNEFAFYGFENPDGIDELVVGVTQTVSGAFAIDNLAVQFMPPPEPPAEEPPTEEPPTEEPPTEEPPAVPALSCEGFDSPVDAWLRRGRDPRLAKLVEHFRGRIPIRVLQARLTDADGAPMTDAEVVAAPRVKVEFTPADGSETMDVTDTMLGKRDDAFVFTRRGHWQHVVGGKRMKKAGTYGVTMLSGDEAEYTLDPTCSKWIVKEAVKKKKRKRWKRPRDRHRRYRGDDDDD